MTSSLLKLLFLFSFLLMALTGTFLVSHSGDHSLKGNCTASLIDNIVCPQDLYSLVLHHFSIFQIFSQVLVSLSFKVILVLLSFLLLFLFFEPPSFLPCFKNYLLARVSNKLSTLSSCFKIRGWLSLLENSPTFSLNT